MECVHQKVGEDIKEPYPKEVQQFLDEGKSQTYATNAAFNALLPLSRRLRKTYLELLKWIQRIKLTTVHRKVIKTLRCFIDEDDMDFHEAMEKRKFLLNSITEKKLLSDELEDDEEAEDEVEASV